jgi:hypothetical protein
MLECSAQVATSKKVPTPKQWSFEPNDASEKRAVAAVRTSSIHGKA